MKTIGGLHTHNPAPETRGRTIRWAQLYDAVVGVMTLGKAHALREMTVEMAQIKAGDTVLDVGCGTGDLTLVAKERAGRAGRVYGVDASPEMIAVARNKASRRGVEIEVHIEVIEKLSFPDEHFDVVLSSLMMHHLPNDLKLRGLAEIQRVLKPGGRLLIVDFKRPTAFMSRALLTLLFHTALETGVQDLPAMMEEAGFTNIDTGDTKFAMLGFARGRAA